MKKFLAIAMTLVLVGMMGACTSKSKRCICTSQRQNYPVCRGIEALGSHASCDDLNRTYVPSDDSTAIVEVKCVAE